MTSETTERGLERLICTALTGLPCDLVPEYEVGERPAAYGAGWTCGDPGDYDREYCVDLAQLSAFLRETQPELSEALALGNDGPTRRKFLARLQGEISRRGTIDVLRHGIKHGAHHLDLFYGTPSPEQPESSGSLRRQPLQRHPPTPLQPGRDATRARPGPLHQRPAGRHVRVEEQPHQTDGRGRRGAVQARSRPAREALRIRPVRGALRGGRPRGAVLHAPERQGLVVPALQPGLERWRGQSAEPGRAQDRLPLEAPANPRRVDEHP